MREDEASAERAEAKAGFAIASDYQYR